MSTNPPFISVIVPAWNEEKAVGRCLQSLQNQTASRDSYEIIVVDDGSTDRTRERAERLGARVIVQPNRGPGAARNLGAANARGDIVLFIDGNCEADPRWLAAMTAPFADSEIAGVSGEKKTRQTGLWPRYIQAEFDDRYNRIGAHRWIDFVDSATAAYRRKVLLDNGAFDTNLKEAEDAELSFRLAERGYGLVLARDAIVYRHHPESPVDYLRRKFEYARWRVAVYARHPQKVTSDTRTPQSQKLQAILALALVPFLLAILIWPATAWLVLILALLFFATTTRFVVRCWQTSPSLGLVAPFALLLVAYATAAGFLLGALEHAATPRVENTGRPST